MSPKLRADRPAFRRTQRFSNHIARSAMILALATILPACSMVPSLPVTGPDPSDPGTPVARVGYASTIGPYQSLRPVSPSSWLEQNRRVAPAPKQ